MSLDAFVAAFGDVIEFTPQAARSAYARWPFATVAALHEALFDGLNRVSPAEQHAFFKRLSDIGENAVPFTAASTAEQAKSGISSLGAADLARLHRLNVAYRAKFDMSYTICVRRNTVQRIFDEFERRLGVDKDTELANVLAEQRLITRLRVVEQVSGPGSPKIYGEVTAHVLNATTGKPASGVAVALYEFFGEQARRAGEGTTDAQGRVTLMSGQPVPIGRYEMRFDLGAYFRETTTPAVEPFFDVVPMRLFIAKPEETTHVPIVATPYSYTTHG